MRNKRDLGNEERGKLGDCRRTGIIAIAWVGLGPPKMYLGHLGFLLLEPPGYAAGIG
jgi:hypothetical protein